MWKCKYCNNEYEYKRATERANHTRWCNDNPKYEEYRTNVNNGSCRKIILMNESKRLTGRVNAQAVAKLEGRIYISPLKGKPGKSTPHTEETKIKLSKIALKSKHRRLVRSIRDYTRKDGTTIKLDSSWEELLAKRLDELNLNWERPNTPIEWIDKNNIIHNYFPDFYLLDYDLYLDPKNPYAYNNQQEKIKILLTMMPNLVILTTEAECKSFSP